ncbi:putative ABC transport system ATP-binding protein [Desulfopila aestuarii DSM 18488]|uniref:Putative ABC transport system ATP-binding protein n=2 Tax=Desulfopila aestuarii TaxID=231440 RepID=A0A1M7YFC2_9BACT|nr:putative ABC transport system ATP-binding protein [Desulfopila aestuarii DSM 18488]
MVRLEDIVKRRSQSESVFELQVPSFAVHPGQMVAVIGESGCGKSTLLDMIALVMEPTEVARFEISTGNTGGVCDVAALWARGDEGALSALRRDFFGYVLQTGGLLPFLSVRQNICLPGRIKGHPILPGRVGTLAKRLGVAGCLDRMPESLSIGQRQRVAIVRALAHQPRLVLADEPTAAVDKARARAIMDDMQRLAEDESVAVVVVTHDVDLIMDRVEVAYTFDTIEVSEQLTRSTCRLVKEHSP